MESTPQQADYCLDIVRADDRARYETGLFAPKKRQSALWGLYAFNQEVAKTRENVSEPALGEIRLQWWRDVLLEVQGGHVREHPVVDAIANHLTAPDVLKLLEEIIAARALDLYDDGPTDFDALKAYAHSVGGALSEAALRISLQADIDQAVIDATRSCGRAWAMLGLVRAIPFHWASNRNFIPGDAGKQSLAMQDADEMFRLAEPSIMEMVRFAEEETTIVDQVAKKVPADARHVFLLNVLTKLHLKNLKAVGGNPFKALEPSSFRRLSAMTMTLLFGR